MNPDLDRLPPYPFQRLAKLRAGVSPPGDRDAIVLSIGEPRHPAPGFVTEALIAHLHGLSSYPATRGSDELRSACARWLNRRFQLPGDGIDPGTQVLPVNGTREALFAFAQAVVERGDAPLVLLPNPFYQIYEGAALLAGAEPLSRNTRAENGFLPDLSAVTETQWQRCQLLYLCSPGNPTGAVMGLPYLQQALQLAQRYDFLVAADECYSEIYFDEQGPPPGLLQAAASLGDEHYRRCVVFHSLSKRSNLPGLRSGFVAGDATVLERFLLYRTYHGCAMPPATQAASQVAWADEAHVQANRAAYREKFRTVLEVLQGHLDVQPPQAGFYLWAATPIPDTDFARELYRQQNVSVLPGSFLSRPTPTGDPGAGRVRIALVGETDECLDAAWRIREFLDRL